MAAKHSILAGKWDFHRFKSTVINDIAVEVTFFSIWATTIVVITKYRTNLGISPQMLTVLGTVLGLVVSFRTSSAYERYWEGRKLWSAITLASRNLGHIIWIHVPVDRQAKPDSPLLKDAKLRAIIEKKSMINLVQAFSVSVKHYLRGESGIYYEDLYPLISFLPRHAHASREFQSEEDTLPIWRSVPVLHAEPEDVVHRSRTTPEASASTADTDMEKSNTPSNMRVPPGVRLMPARNPPRTSVYDYVPILLPLKPFFRLISKAVRKPSERTGRNWLGRKIKADISVDSNIPLEICLFLSTYFSTLLNQNLLQPAIATAYMNNLTSFQDSVTALERVRSTPIPFAYQMHLRMTIWLYLLLLPFQIVSSLHWITIPATAFASFLFLGFLEIGAEIEDPFDYDANDLDLDAFCNTIARELSEVVAHPAIDPTTYIFNDMNTPLAPSDMRSAKAILANVNHDYHHEEYGLYSVRRTLLRSWRETNDISRSKSI